jgi:aryl-alcohol dehydrogenase-like predicted oxidoreductase
VEKSFELYKRTQSEFAIHMGAGLNNGLTLKEIEEVLIQALPYVGYLGMKIDAQTKVDSQKDVRSEFPRFSPENMAANMPIVAFLKQFSVKKSATPVQISLAWLLAQKPFIVPIPGTRSAGHLHENLRSVDVHLTPTDIREIGTALSKIEVQGGRMNEERMKAVDQTE